MSSRIRVYTHTCEREFLQTHRCIYIYIYIYTCVCVCVCVCAHARKNSSISSIQIQTLIRFDFDSWRWEGFFIILHGRHVARCTSSTTTHKTPTLDQPPPRILSYPGIVQVPNKFQAYLRLPAPTQTHSDIINIVVFVFNFVYCKFYAFILPHGYQVRVSLTSLIYIYIYIYIVVVECSPMIRETYVQSQVESYQRLLKWYLIPPCLTLSNIRYVSRVK